VLYPYIKWAIARMLLKLFFKPLFGGDVVYSEEETILVPLNNLHRFTEAFFVTSSPYETS